MSSTRTILEASRSILEMDRTTTLFGLSAGEATSFAQAALGLVPADGPPEDRGVDVAGPLDTARMVMVVVGPVSSSRVVRGWVELEASVAQFVSALPTKGGSRTSFLRDPSRWTFDELGTPVLFTMSTDTGHVTIAPIQEDRTASITPN